MTLDFKWCVVHLDQHIFHYLKLLGVYGGTLAAADVPPYVKVFMIC